MSRFSRTQTRVHALGLLAAVLLSFVFALRAAPDRAQMFEAAKGPSIAIYPPQSIPLAFSHKKHTQDLKVACTECHQKGKTSRSSADNLLAPGTACDRCHGTNHSDTSHVTSTSSTTSTSADRLGQCALCHEGEGIAKVRIEPPNLHFSHQAHSARNIGCLQCHQNIETTGKATRDDLPRMQGCVRCHHEGESGGDAKAACETCHVKGGAAEGGRIRTEFATGKLLPPRWLRNAAHDSGFLARHKMVAGDDSQFCANCHKEEFCTDCHDGRVRPRAIHPNDYLSMHAAEARQQTQTCSSCHREQSFCLSCHQRLGVSMSGPTAVRETGRFHPPKAIFSDVPRQPGHHAQEAARNLNACVSCHIERDCVACHGARGVGGGHSPHPPGFQNDCARLFARNPRPCLVCHESERELAQCL